ncbi:inovirus Gp2 family protein [Paraburkholderia madseniana]|uniref:Inovirus Gp2 family protein n=1 Tax=Paraburkholderia madseniana TaxID=2599607 RepID=A0A6N6WLK1_9BURK|nr:inovirus-type Gp2 protein [Paraburkholderia madseniana]KAE8760848.1 inovirus Gp2 family protein [Paraburkholderia madseniana]
MSYEEDDFSKIYKYSDLIKNTEGKEIEGKEGVEIHRDFDLMGPLLADMEALVREIEFSKGGVGFTWERDGKNRLVPIATSLGKRYFSDVMVFFELYAFAERYVFSPHVEALCEAFAALELHPSFFPFRGNLPDPGTGKTPLQLFNDVLAKVAEIVGSSKFREQLRVRRRNAERNEAKGLAIEQQVFANRSRQLVLMLHFGYEEKHRSSVTLEEIQQHRKKFFNNCRTNKLLRGIVDYIWKIEEGEESGLHLHMLIFYSADSCRDVHIAKQIGEYWVKVTGGKGRYWNSNANKLFHEKYGHGIGTGEINWDDDAKREALRTNIRYMAKADQFLKARLDGCHLFGTSQVKDKKKIGRPRSKKPKLDDEPADITLADSLDNTGTDAMSPDTDLDD